MTRIVFLAFILLIGCTVDSLKEYAANFENHMKNHGIVLKADSLQFPNEVGAEVVLIPGQIGLAEELLFENSSDEKIYVKRLNYTDYQYRIDSPKLNEKGRVSLLPTFYLGAEFRGENEDLVVATFYPTVASDNCLEELGIGNYNINHGTVSTFITLRLKSECQLFGGSDFYLLR